MTKFDVRVLDQYLQTEPPHLALIRAAESVFYAKYLPFPGTILDVGCGDGFFAWSVYQQQKIDVGIDVKESLWKEAKARGNYKKVMVYDGERIPFVDNSFDTVVSNCVLEHVPKAGKLIKEMSRVCKKGGKVIVTVVTDKFGDNMAGTKIMGKAYKNWFNRKSIHVSPFSKEEWLKEFEKSGLKMIEVSEYVNENKWTIWHDISHYWGIPNLICRKLTGKWVWGLSRLTNFGWKKVFEGLKGIKSKKVDSPYLFIAAQK